MQDNLPEEAAPPPAQPRAASAGADEDVGLVDRARAGDARAFEALVRRYQGWVFTLALRMVGDRAEAEDVAQEVFLKAYRGLPDFRGASRFTTWLYTIATRHCLTHLEARARRPRAYDPVGSAAGGEGDELPSAVDRLPDGAPLADALLERWDLARMVQAELQQLKEEHRVILILRDIQGLAYEEIAEVLGVELGTVRSRLHRARMDLRARLAPQLRS
jgi:RNA polymerase sigma-70 factor (ECF subfamily)